MTTHIIFTFNWLVLLRCSINVYVFILLSTGLVNLWHMVFTWTNSSANKELPKLVSKETITPSQHLKMRLRVLIIRFTKCMKTFMRTLHASLVAGLTWISLIRPRLDNTDTSTSNWSNRPRKKGQKQTLSKLPGLLVFKDKPQRLFSGLKHLSLQMVHVFNTVRLPFSL